MIPRYPLLSSLCRIDKSLECDMMPYRRRFVMAQRTERMQCWDDKTRMAWEYNDGGRADAGYNGNAEDCVTRAIAIATHTSYQMVYDALNGLATHERRKRRS